MKATPLILGLAIACLSLCTPCTADRTATDRTLQDFWNQFQEGDSNIDVYSSLRPLVMAYTDQQNRSTVLQWHCSSSQFTLFLRNEEVTDLVTGSDEWNRPTFHGLFNAQNQAQLQGFVDVSPDGTLVVEITELSHTTRYDTSSNASVLSGKECRCITHDIAGAWCLAQNCIAQDACEISGRCNWYDPGP